MITAYNYFRKLTELKNKGHVPPGFIAELDEIFQELPPELRQMMASVVSDGKVNRTEIVQLSDYIRRKGKPGGFEIRLLFEIHDHVYGNANAAEWENFFFEETSKFFLDGIKERKSLPLSKAALLLYQIKNSINRLGIMSEVEIKLIKELISFTGDNTFMRSTDSHFLAAFYDKILQDSQIDVHEVEMLQEMVFQDKPPKKEDMDLLFDINRALRVRTKHQKWSELFIEAIILFLLNEGKLIDYSKVGWLEGKLQTSETRFGTITIEEIHVVRTLRDKAGFLPPELETYFMKYCQG
jgi:hypothetical protein